MLTALRKTSLTDGFHDEIDLKTNILDAIETAPDSSIYNITTTTGVINVADIKPARLFIRFNEDNAGEAQIQINGRELSPLVSIDGMPLEARSIIPNLVYTVDFDGVAFFVNTESAETLSNVMRYSASLPLPSGPNGKFTYEDFFNHFVPIGESTVLANTGLDFPKYKVYPFNGNDVVLTYGLLKWETDVTKQTLTLEIDFPEIEEKYTIVKFLVVSKNEDDPTCRIAGSTEILSSDWDRTRKEVVQSNFYEGHYMITLSKPNNLNFLIEKTDGQEFAVGTLIEVRGQTFLNLTYKVDPDYTGTLNSVMSVRPRFPLHGRIWNRGTYIRVGKDGEPDKNKVVTLNRYLSTWGDGSTEGDGQFQTGATLGLADNDRQYIHAQLYMCRSNQMSVNSTLYGTDPVYDATSKQEAGVTTSQTSAYISDESGKIDALMFMLENISTDNAGNDTQFHVTIKSPRKSDLDNLKIYY